MVLGWAQDIYASKVGLMSQQPPGPSRGTMRGAAKLTAIIRRSRNGGVRSPFDEYGYTYKPAHELLRNGGCATNLPPAAWPSRSRPRNFKRWERTFLVIPRQDTKSEPMLPTTVHQQ